MWTKEYRFAYYYGLLDVIIFESQEKGRQFDIVFTDEMVQPYKTKGDDTYPCEDGVAVLIEFFFNFWPHTQLKYKYKMRKLIIKQWHMSCIRRYLYIVIYNWCKGISKSSKSIESQ